MSDFQTIADRVEIEALRGEFTDAAMMRDYDRLASLFTRTARCGCLTSRSSSSARRRSAPGASGSGSCGLLGAEHAPGTIALDGDIASGRAYMSVEVSLRGRRAGVKTGHTVPSRSIFGSELGRTRDGRQGLNYAIYHDRYRRTGDAWKFTERVYEVRYEDTTPRAGSPPRPAGAPADPPAGNTAAAEGRR